MSVDPRPQVPHTLGMSKTGVARVDTQGSVGFEDRRVSVLLIPVVLGLTVVRQPKHLSVRIKSTTGSMV